MKLAYNITLPLVHTLALLVLVGMGFARMMAWLCWFWVNDVIYILTAAVFLSGHWLLLYGGKRKGLTPHCCVLSLMGTLDYILYSLQLALVVAWLVWETVLPLLVKGRSYSVLVPLTLLPVAAVDICAMVLRLKTNRSVQPQS